MRICYLTDGRFIHAHRGLKFFSERGHEMSLLSYAPMESHHVTAVENAGAKYLGQLGAFHLKRFWRTALELPRLRRLLRREKIDIVHSHFLSVNSWYVALSGFHPAVITVMGGDILGEDWRPGRDIRERWLTPYALRNADLITCWSKKLTSVVKRYSRPETPVEVIHGGVDLQRFTPGPRRESLLERWALPPNSKIVLSPRLLRPLYNLDSIAAAARKLCAVHPDIYFLFTFLEDASDQDYQAQVREIVDADSLTRDRVRFIGSVAHEEMVDYYRLADATISIPSSDGTPMSVLESMACGTPVVVSDIPHYDEDYIEAGQTALLAAPRDVSSIVSALERLLNDRELADRLAGEGRRRVVEKGSYAAQMTRMEQLYQAL